jgi:CheY-like chemotaxis protein
MIDRSIPDGEFVLVVDDEADAGESLCEVVEIGGCRAVAAANGADALAVLAQARPCLVLLDLLMPVMSGAELLHALRREPRFANLPVVIVTSAPEKAPAGVPIIPKPIALTAVWRWMHQTCQCAAHALSQGSKLKQPV